MTREGSALAWCIWSLAVAFVVYTFSFQTGYSIVNSGVQQDTGLSVSRVATIAAVYTWAFAVCQLFGGALLDRLGSRIVILILSALYMRNPEPVAGGVRKGIGEFVTSVIGDIVQVGKIGHVWIASIIGAAQFGVMLALGVVWMPKLLMVHGLSQSTAGFVASMLWLGAAAGSATFPWWSGRIKSRRLPIRLGSAVTLTCLLALLYVPLMGRGLAIILCLTLGFASACNMIAFSTVADVMKPSQIGTSAAIVNGVTFLVGGILISRPGMRIGSPENRGILPQRTPETVGSI